MDKQPRDERQDEWTWFTDGDRLWRLWERFREDSRALYELEMRPEEIAENLELQARSDILTEATHKRPDGFRSLLERLRAGLPLKDAMPELFGPEVPLGAAIAPLRGIAWEARQWGPDLEVARVVRGRVDQLEGIQPTFYVWRVGVRGPSVVQFGVEEREGSGIGDYQLVKVEATR